MQNESQNNYLDYITAELPPEFVDYIRAELKVFAEAIAFVSPHLGLSVSQALQNNDWKTIKSQTKDLTYVVRNITVLRYGLDRFGSKDKNKEITFSAPIIPYNRIRELEATDSLQEEDVKQSLAYINSFLKDYNIKKTKFKSTKAEKTTYKEYLEQRVVGQPDLMCLETSQLPHSLQKYKLVSLVKNISLFYCMADGGKRKQLLEELHLEIMKNPQQAKSYDALEYVIDTAKGLTPPVDADEVKSICKKVAETVATQIIIPTVTFAEEFKISPDKVKINFNHTEPAEDQDTEKQMIAIVTKLYKDATSINLSKLLKSRKVYNKALKIWKYDRCMLYTYSMHNQFLQLFDKCRDFHRAITEKDNQI